MDSVCFPSKHVYTLTPKYSKSSGAVQSHVNCVEVNSTDVSFPFVQELPLACQISLYGQTAQCRCKFWCGGVLNNNKTGIKLFQYTS